MTASLRKQHGVVYTPQPIVELILDNVLPTNAAELANSVICDPACGDGAFLTIVARRALTLLNRADALRTLRRMTGYDIDPVAVSKCKRNLDKVLHELYPSESVDWNVVVRDVLHHTASVNDYGRFTHVVGNPPYVRIQHLEQVGRDKIAQRWRLLRGASDLYIVFYEFALKLLREGGLLGFITPSSWIRSASGSLLRKHLVTSHKVKKIIDFGDRQMFSDVTTYTAIAVVQKGGATAHIPVDTRNSTGSDGNGSVVLDRDNPSKAWWIVRSQSDRERMERLLGRSVLLKDIADIHVGIQTLADRVFIMPYEKSVDMGLERWIMRDIVKASLMKDGQDPVRRVVIFPYDDDGKLIPEERIADEAPNAYAWLVSNKASLLGRDKGAFNPARWHGFGRQVSIVSGFGDKILTSGMNRYPNFQKCPDPNATFYGGYCVKPKPHVDMGGLLQSLNSSDMDFFIKNTSRPYQGGWMSYAKSFIENFPVDTGSGMGCPKLF